MLLLDEVDIPRPFIDGVERPLEIVLSTSIRVLLILSSESMRLRGSASSPPVVPLCEATSVGGSLLVVLSPLLPELLDLSELRSSPSSS